MSALTIADINTAVNHEPRIEDLRLAEALGFERPRAVRELIERQETALARFGEVCRTVRQTSERGGRPGKTYWLNLRQALYLATKSEAENAVDLTVEMVDLFAAVKEGRQVSALEDRAPTDLSLSRPNLAMLRLGGKVVLVDTRRYRVGPEDRVVRIHHDGRIDIGKVMMRDDGRYGALHGARGYLEKTRKYRKGDPECAKRAIGISGVVQVLGVVMDEIPIGRPQLPKPRPERVAVVDRTKFDAAAFVDDLRSAGCGVGLMTPVATPGYGIGQPSYAISPPDGCKTGEVARSVLRRWSVAIKTCPDHAMRVAAHLAAQSRAMSPLALTRH